uniref:tRNA splicing endonuclease subunit 54 n=1 Tax=Sphenodon punctatus TaxID=8508 RepID=A0A8D0GV74_SPHPU
METEPPPPRKRRRHRRRLCPAELLAARKRDRKVPQRSHGQKDFIPDGSEEQAERLRLCREEHWQLLEEERVERLGSLVEAKWNAQEGIIELNSPAGKFWHTMGFTERGKQCLLPEEALYLLECGSIQLFYKDLPMSIQEAYETLLSQSTVFSHLKRLGYIVLRFRSSTVPSSYERQLNLDAHGKNSEKRPRKRKRCSSPRLQDKKAKAFEKPQDTEGTPEMESGSQPDPNHSAPDGSCLSAEKSEEPNPGEAEGDQAEATGATARCRDSEPQTGDGGEASAEVSEESSDGSRPPRWDFATITFPNVAADSPQTLLPEPDKELLPENVAGREIDTSRWRGLLNQKRERPSQKERDQRFRSSVNADKKVRRCHNWREYKALLRERSKRRAKSRPSHLWDQAVTPLVEPDRGVSTAALLQQISVLQPSHVLDGA